MRGVDENGPRRFLASSVPVVLLVVLLATSCTSSVGTGGRVNRERVGAAGVTSLATGVEPPPPAVPRPFGKLSCVARDGMRFCKGGLVNGKDLAVPSFDGVPLSADVALPATGKGPFPLIVLLHGFGASKSEFETSANDGSLDDATMAARGWAVLMYTARGFGSSCGTVALRVATPACAKGWIHVADQRYEVRDTQYLAGELVDEGLVKPVIAVAGVSYGAEQSLELATLKNRMRLRDGKFVPFVSPRRHVPMSVGAVYAIWAPEDLAASLMPNGRVMTGSYTSAAADVNPAGVAKESWIKGLLQAGDSAYFAPPGKDPQSAMATWFHEFLGGEPYSRAALRALSIIQEYKSAIGVPLPRGGPAPTAIQNGWTDSLFPATQALQYANRINAAHDRTPLLMMFDDVGHGWAQDKPADTAFTNKTGIAFLDAVVRDGVRPMTGVVVIPQTCPASAPSGPPERGASLAAMQHGAVVLGSSKSEVVSSSGGSPATSRVLDPVSSYPLCNSLPVSSSTGTAIYTRAVGAKSVTLLGAASVSANVHIVGRYPELVARLWDVSANGTRQIVSMGVVRPDANQSASTVASAVANERIVFQLNPNEYTFAAGHTFELQLVGSNSPYFRKSNGTFSIAVSELSASIPIR
ncbi:MAG: alpha/beta fold hydrolase [Actinobacteria bacterium]|nr:alpha/beta fold hydrolase [Actinomycetota bacterium]